MGLRLGVGTRQPLSRSLHRKAELMQQSRHVMIVITNAESSSDPIADHRSSPHAAGKANRLRSGLDDGDQFVLLIGAQPRRWTRRNAWPQSLAPGNVVPLQPSID
jgi:hypothetical protein